MGAKTVERYLKEIDKTRFKETLTVKTVLYKLTQEIAEQKEISNHTS